MRNWRADLNKQLGEKIFLDAQRDYLTGELHRQSAISWLAYALAAIVLVSPFLMIGLGLALGISAFPNIAALIFAALLIAMGLYLLPRRSRLPEAAAKRPALPKTFALVDQIGAKLEAPQIDAIVVTEDFNAAVGQTRQGTYLEIGALLWESLDNSQRTALLAHELGHLVNGDPTRYGLLGRALFVLDGWHSIFCPDGSDYSLVGEMISAVIAAVIEVIWMALERLSYLPQQRAEYLADALSAEVAGSEAAQSLLKHILLLPEVEREILSLSGTNLPDGIDMVRRLAHATKDVPLDTYAALERAAMQEGNATDRTHPPTAFRIAFLQTLPERCRRLDPADLGFDEASKELLPHLEKAGRKITSSLMVQ